MKSIEWIEPPAGSDVSGSACSEKQSDGDHGPANTREHYSVIAVPILVIHLLAAVACLPVFWNLTNIIALVVGTLVFGQAINLGYHRILAHKSLVVPKWLERFYVLLALCSLEESPGKWVSTHRRHHNHSDSQEDPHSPVENFGWSHLGWLLKSRNGQQEFYHDDKYSADLMKDSFYRALEANPILPGLIFLIHAILIFVTSFGIGLAVGVENPLLLATGILFWGCFLRTIVVWHITWSVNSLAHSFGYQNYQTGDQSRNNWLVALLSSGEGWHNNHHHDSASASNQHRWWELDLTYCHILVLEALGLATNVIRPRHLRSRDLQTSQDSLPPQNTMAEGQPAAPDRDPADCPSHSNTDETTAAR